MNNNLLSEIHRIGALRYPNEACGFIIKTGKNKSALIETSNNAAYPTVEFLINHDEYSRAEDQGEIIGVWHTHTNGNTEPSEADLASCEATGVTWYLTCVTRHEDGSFSYSDLRTFNPNGYEQPYVGRPYVFGVFDCWTLVRDFYRREFGIELRDYPRIEDFWMNGNNFFEQKWQDEGLVIVTDRDFRYGDILFFQTDGTGLPSHSGIYVGEERFLHHFTDRLSRHDPYGGYWLKHTVKHLRHKDKC